MLESSASARPLGETIEFDIEPTGTNTTTRAELLRRAKTAIEAGEQSLHEAAEALGVAQELHGVTQREMANTIGKSASWVNKLLKWRRSGYKDHSPFGPTTKRGRVEHAQQGAKSSKPGKPRAEIPQKAEDLENPSPTEAKNKLICALDLWWRYLDDSGKNEVIDRFLDKADQWDDAPPSETSTVRKCGGDI